jgi:sec-independent protein translocase protein TatC
MSYGNHRQADQDDPFNDTRMSFGDHIEELRWHLIRAIIGFCVALIGSFFLGDYVLRIISKPVEDALGIVYDKRAKHIMEEYKEKNLGGKDQAVEGMQEMNGKDLAAALKKRGVAVPAAVESAPDEWFPVRYRIHASDNLDVFYLQQKLLGPRPTLKVFNVVEGFMVWFKVCMVTALVLSSPWVFYQIWSFIAAGLYPHEKRLVNLYMPFSAVLFLLGVALCQIWVIPIALNFLLGFSMDLNVEPDLRLSEWLSFAIWMPVVFGLSFQTPLVMLFLERIGVGSVQGFRRRRKIAWFVMVLSAAFVFPSPDMFSFLLLAGPMVLLYELGIMLCIWSPRQEGVDVDAPEPGEMVEV